MGYDAAPPVVQNPNAFGDRNLRPWTPTRHLTCANVLIVSR
jgi:hypothetical protein